MTEKDLQKEIVTLKSEIRRLKKNYLGLVFEDKPEDIMTQCRENVPVLKEVKARRIVSDDQNQNNLLIEGDNYHSLSVLNYTHKKNIDLIYIDPPYNTGANNWKYKKIIGDRSLTEEEIYVSNLRNWGNESERTDAKNCFYPIIISKNKIVC